MEMYWSAVVILRNKPEATVEETMLTQLLAKRVNTPVMLSNMPPAVMAPPKHMAQMINQMVSSMPDMPLVAIKSLISAFPVSKLVLPNKMLNAPFVRVKAYVPASPAISTNNSGWKITAKMVAKAVERNKVISEGTFLAIIMAVTIGTIISHPDM